MSEEALEWGIHILVPQIAGDECKHYFTCPVCGFHYTDYIGSPAKESCPKCNTVLVIGKFYTGSRNKILKGSGSL